MNKKNPNPQGKGLVPVLHALQNAQTALSVPPKHIQQISDELFTSLFVLESRFAFKPVINKPYWLYRRDEGFVLSLLAPENWSAAIYYQFIGCCELHGDLVWTLELSAEALADEALMDQIASRRAAFEADLQSIPEIDQALPVFKQELPFYQRVYASGLANSLRYSMQQSGIQGLSYQQAKGMLEYSEVAKEPGFDSAQPSGGIQTAP